MNRPIRKTLLGVNQKNVRLDIRGFYYESPIIKKHLENIGSHFLLGYHAYLENPVGVSFLEELNKVNDEYIGFTYEGSAMAMALLDFFNPLKKPRLPRFMEEEGKNHIYMLHVGAGWAMARLPIRPEKIFNKYHPLYKWLAIDGFGFHQAYFLTKKYVRQQKKPNGLTKGALHVFYQGVGRCLWFVEGSVPQKIAATINMFPSELHPDMWAGVGLAAAYAGGVDKETLMAIASFSGKHLPCLGQGAAFAAKARSQAGNMILNTEIACSIFTERSAKDLAEITDEAMNQLNIDQASVEVYEQWRALIKSMIYEKLTNYA